jgi:hypothetical protein
MNSHSSSFKVFTDNSPSVSTSATIPTNECAQREPFLAAAVISASVKSRSDGCRRQQTSIDAAIVRIAAKRPIPTVFVSAEERA